MPTAGQWQLSDSSAKMATLKLVLRTAVVALAISVAYGGINQVPMPTIDVDEWWASGVPGGDEDKTVNDFQIQFTPALISDLKTRLLAHRAFHAPLEGAAFNYGMSSTELENWIQYMANQYPYDTRQKFLNQYSHYTTIIQGLKIHFVRVTSPDAKTATAVPLLLLHGWPASVREFYETAPLLISTGKTYGLAMDLIIASLPGFGFSDGAVKPGLGVDKAAIIMRNLMRRMGFKQYYVQGGELGSMIGSCMATFFPDEVLGFHTNYPLFHNPSMIVSLLIGNYHKDEITSSDLLNRLYPSWDVFCEIMTSIGYLHEQATKPDTVGYGLMDSPAALMGYTLEKFSSWVRRDFINRTDGGLTQIFTRDQILDNYMIYWLSNSITTSMRMYAETFNKRYLALRLNEIKSPVPCWALQTKEDLIYLPDYMIKQKFPNLLGMTLPTEGGHFYAWEKPQEFAQDVVNAIVAFQKWHAMNSTMFTQCSSYIDY